MDNIWHRARSAKLLALTVVAATALTTAACSSGGGGSGSSPTQITMWVRAANATYNQTVVDAYNASSKSKISLTVIPDANFLTKLSTASSSGKTPDLIASDVVYAAQLLQTHQLKDITDAVNKMSFKSSLAPSYLKAMTNDGKIYGVPQNPDASALFYNKDLFRQAGLDPNKPPASWAEIATDAAKISALGGGVKGFYFSGNCANCNAYTFLPLVWASGSDVLSDDGKSVQFDTPQMTAAMSFYHSVWAAQNVPPAAKTDTGANFLAAFQTGNVGIEGLGAFAVGPLATAKFSYGVAPLPGESGGQSAFAGGDVLAVPSHSSHESQALDFIRWFLSDNTQIEIVAKNGGMTARTDLADNKYAAKSPALEEINKLLATARSPYSTHYNAMFNDPNGPFATAFQKAVFDGDNSVIANAQKQMTSILASGN